MPGRGDNFNEVIYGATHIIAMSLTAKEVELLEVFIAGSGRELRGRGKSFRVMVLTSDKPTTHLTVHSDIRPINSYVIA